MRVYVELEDDDKITSIFREVSPRVNELSENHEMFRQLGLAVGQLVTRLASEFNVPTRTALMITNMHSNVKPCDDSAER